MPTFDETLNPISGLLDPAGARAGAADATQAARAHVQAFLARRLKQLLPFRDERHIADVSHQWASDYVGDYKSPETMAARGRALALAQAMHPTFFSQGSPQDKQAAYTQLASALSDYGLNTFQSPDGNEVAIPDSLLPAMANMAARQNYPGAGWSPDQVARHEKQYGSRPGRNRLSPGDLVSYTADLDADTLKELQGSLERHQATPGGNYGDPLNERDNVLKNSVGAALDVFGNAYQNPVATQFTGGVYPKHRGKNAFGDAISSHVSPIGSYLQGGVFFGDWLWNALAGEKDPGSRAAAYYQGRKLYGIPSPQGVPAGTPEDRDAFVRHMRNATEKTSSPNYSEWSWDKTGKAPSYLEQGMMSIANMLADPSQPAAFGGSKIIKLLNKVTAGRTIPFILGHAAGYGSRAGQKVPMVMDYGDPVFAAGMNSATTAASPVIPPISKWASSGEENRPDLTSPSPYRPYGLVGDEASQAVTSPSRSSMPPLGRPPMPRVRISDHMEDQRQDADQAVREINAAMNSHPDAPQNNPGILGTIGGGLGWLAQGLGENLVKAAETSKQAKAPPVYMAR